MQVVLDPQIFINQRAGGISRQFVEIALQLRTYKDISVLNPLLYSDNIHIQDANFGINRLQKFLSGTRLVNNSGIRGYINHGSLFCAKKLAGRRSTGAFITTYYEPYFLKDLGKTPLLLTVYDMIHEKFPHFFPEDFSTVRHKRILIQNAAHIIVHSDRTKCDLLEIYTDVDQQKVSVVPLASSLQSAPNLNKIPRSLPYLLFVGTRKGYKNFAFFLKVAQSFLITGNMHLICIGGGAFDHVEMKLIRELGISNAVRQITVSDTDLHVYYRGATAFIFPSIYEGFGIPVLEALTCECPAILADNGVFREVAGDAAAYFNPYDAHTLHTALNRVLYNTNYANHLVQLGKSRVLSYSWNATAAGYYHLIRQLKN